MLLIFMGPSSTGKSTVADNFKKTIGLTVYSGNDYLRMAKNENEAWDLFYDKLLEASKIKSLSKDSIVYVITEKDVYEELQTIENAYFVKFTSTFETIKDRFTQRLRGNLVPPLEKMLEKQLSDWNEVNANLTIDTTDVEASEVTRQIQEAITISRY